MAALCCGAQRSADSAAIDTQLKKELAGEKHSIRILILGTSASGKSTVAKQMKIIHSNGFTNEELENYKQILILNIFNGMKELVLQAEGLNIKVTRKNKKVATYFVEVNPYTEKLDAETVAKAKQLWADSGSYFHHICLFCMQQFRLLFQFDHWAHVYFFSFFSSSKPFVRVLGLFSLDSSTVLVVPDFDAVKSMFSPL
jgi:hypothetical protein